MVTLAHVCHAPCERPCKTSTSPSETEQSERSWSGARRTSPVSKPSDRARQTGPVRQGPSDRARQTGPVRQGEPSQLMHGGGEWAAGVRQEL